MKKIADIIKKDLIVRFIFNLILLILNNDLRIYSDCFKHIYLTKEIADAKLAI